MKGKFQGSLRNKLILLSVGVLALYYVLVSLFSIVFMEPYYWSPTISTRWSSRW